MQNIFRDAEGNKITQWTMEAEAWDLCIEQIKKNAVYINGTPWSDSDLLLIIKQLHFNKNGGWLCFIPDDSPSEAELYGNPPS